ncbi:uncharacterized protein [Musca autumnalis]|uniref:uncharacterized protein n=1 Tax=Musca autumnalis TaxID=221902 RepID=UPI003CEA1A30
MNKFVIDSEMHIVFVFALLWCLVTAANVPQNNNDGPQPILTSNESQILELLKSIVIQNNGKNEIVEKKLDRMFDKINVMEEHITPQSEPNTNEKSELSEFLATYEKSQAALIARMDTYEKNLEVLKLEVLEINKNSIEINTKLIETNAKIESFGKGQEELVNKFKLLETISQANVTTLMDLLLENKAEIEKLAKTNAKIESVEKTQEEVVDKFQLLETATQANVTNLMEMVLHNKAEMQNMAKTQKELQDTSDDLQQ